MHPTFCFGAMLAMSQPAGRLSPGFTFASAAALSRAASSAASSPGCNTHHIWLLFAFTIDSTDDDTVLWRCSEFAAAFSCVAGFAASSPGCRALAHSLQILWIADHSVGCLRRHVFVRKAAGSSPSFEVSFVFHQLRTLTPGYHHTSPLPPPRVLPRLLPALLGLQDHYTSLHRHVLVTC